MPSPANQAQVYRMTPNQYNLLRNEQASLLIEPKCTEPYYNKPV